MAQKRGELDVRIVFECEEEDYERMLRWLVSALQTAARNSTHGMVVTAVYDSDGKMLGHNITGTPPENAQDLLDSIFEKSA